MERHKIVLVEDEKDIRELMALHLTREGFKLQIHENGEAADAALKKEGCDLAIFDWMLPGMSGLELCQAHRGKFPILMVTARAETLDIVRGLATGADDYIVKPFEMAVLIARVHALLRRSSYTLPSMVKLQMGDIIVDESLYEVTVAGNKVPFTPIEFKILAILMKNIGRVLTRQSLLDHIQSEEVTVTERTIDVHIYAIRKKIGSHADMIETIRGVGYRIHQV